MAFWAWLLIWLQPLEDKVVSELLSLAECALFTSGVPMTLKSAGLVGPEWLAGRGTVALDQLQWPQSTGHGCGMVWLWPHKHFSQHMSTSGALLCPGLPVKRS